MGQEHKKCLVRKNNTKSHADILPNKEHSLPLQPQKQRTRTHPLQEITTTYEPTPTTNPVTKPDTSFQDIKK